MAHVGDAGNEYRIGRQPGPGLAEQAVGIAEVFENRADDRVRTGPTATADLVGRA